MTELDKIIKEKLMADDSVIQRNFSSDIGDAFAVLAKLHSQAWFWRLDSVHDGVICTVQNVKRKTYQVRAPNAAQAICECAVKTLETT